MDSATQNISSYFDDSAEEVASSSPKAPSGKQSPMMRSVRRKRPSKLPLHVEIPEEIEEGQISDASTQLEEMKRAVTKDTKKQRKEDVESPQSPCSSSANAPSTPGTSGSQSDAEQSPFLMKFPSHNSGEQAAMIRERVTRNDTATVSAEAGRLSIGVSHVVDQEILAQSKCDDHSY